MAADYNLEEKVLVVTTSSGRPVWQRAIRSWSPFGRVCQVLNKGTDRIAPDAGVVIVSWSGITNPKIRSQLLGRKWDRLVLDEAHMAKSVAARRTQSAYGEFTLGGSLINDSTALARAADYKVWCLTGTPLPNSPADAYPMLRALRPHCLHARDGMPDVTKYDDFLHRYCVVRMKKISNFRKIPVVVGGRNLEELRSRIGDFMLRRTQQDVGIRAPIYETLPLAVSPAMRREVEGNLDAAMVLAAAEAGDTKTLDMQLGPLRRLTGEIKAHAVVAAVKEEFECGLDKIVLAYWHKDVGQVLKDGLSTYGVVGIDGSSGQTQRGEAEQRFLHDPSIRVFLGQIKAAGEAIDLSSSANLWFVETSFTPSDMAQMSKRVTNLLATRQSFVRVAVLEGSIDEALQEILLRKWTAIREVIS
jgi:SNF2 family DNA or RNA helicase